MLRLKNLSEIYQKRLIRPEYAHHQATPYAVALHSSFYNTDGSLRVPLGADTTPLARQSNTAPSTLHGSLVPGLVMVRVYDTVTGSGESVAVATGAVAEQPFGLLANFVGGDFDEIGPQNVGSGVVGVWRGPDSTYTLLAPAFDPSITSTTLSADTTGAPIQLYAGLDGRLTATSPGAGAIPVARLIDVVGTSRITIDLAV